jgi:hypothetical protein
MGTFVKGRAAEDEQSLKLRWIQFVWLSFTAHVNQAGVMPDKNATHNTAHKYAHGFEI